MFTCPIPCILYYAKEFFNSNFLQTLVTGFAIYFAYRIGKEQMGINARLLDIEQAISIFPTWDSQARTLQIKNLSKVQVILKKVEIPSLNYRVLSDRPIMPGTTVTLVDTLGDILFRDASSDSNLINFTLTFEDRDGRKILFNYDFLAEVGDVDNKMIKICPVK